jgi:hypothetical protein
VESSEQCTATDHGNTGLRKTTVRCQTMVQWLEDFINKVGDYMPHKNEIHITVGSLKKLYSMYKRYCSTHLITGVVSYETMRLKFQDVKDFVKIPKTKMFTRCDTCDDLDTKIKDSQNPKQKKVHELNKSTHLQWQFNEREVYYRHRYQAQKPNSDVACIIIDGMDQKKTNVPRYHTRLSKSCDNLEQLGVTIIGSLIHGHTPLMHYMPNDFKKDCNVTIQVLVNCIMAMKEERRLKGFKWPSTFYLQLDGVGDNKNKHVLAFLAHLVQAELFTQVCFIIFQNVIDIYHILDAYIVIFVIFFTCLMRFLKIES